MAAVRGGLLSIEEACDRYNLTVDEFRPGPRSTTTFAFRPRSTRIQDYAVISLSRVCLLRGWLEAAVVLAFLCWLIFLSQFCFLRWLCRGLFVFGRLCPRIPSP